MEPKLLSREASILDGTQLSAYTVVIFSGRSKVLRRCVSGLRYSYDVRDLWTRLSVLPAKILNAGI